MYFQNKLYHRLSRTYSIFPIISPFEFPHRHSVLFLLFSLPPLFLSSPPFPHSPTNSLISQPIPSFSNPFPHSLTPQPTSSFSNPTPPPPHPLPCRCIPPNLSPHAITLPIPTLVCPGCPQVMIFSFGAHDSDHLVSTPLSPGGGADRGASPQPIRGSGRVIPHPPPPKQSTRR